MAPWIADFGRQQPAGFFETASLLWGVILSHESSAPMPKRSYALPLLCEPGQAFQPGVPASGQEKMTGWKACPTKEF